MKPYLTAAIFSVMTALSGWFAFDTSQRLATLERHDRDNQIIHAIEHARINALHGLPNKEVTK